MIAISTQDKRKAVIEHLEELRLRIIKCAVFIIAASVICYNFSGKILSNIIKPAGRTVFIAPQEAFVTHVKVAFITGALASVPFILFETWRFVSEALQRQEKKYILLFAPLSLVLFAIGAFFGYAVILPVAMKFLLGFSTEYITPMLSVGMYVSFAGLLIFAFGIMFELPIAALFATKIGLVTPYFLSKRRREAVVIIFIIAAFFTPPDAVTQILMAVPLLALYEASILFSKLVYKRGEI
ncbi:MAG: twin-arginine translocase subunit TatC [Candidatus Omnitrophica bacterium]|nr:twin-arginine translocase subunit TatC [Candidatus Omnitrophota bacterium]